MIRLQLELGGNDPAYVTDEVDVAAAAAAVADGASTTPGKLLRRGARLRPRARLLPFRKLRRGGEEAPARKPTMSTYVGPLCRVRRRCAPAEQVADA